jgi:hypothetical protein
MIKKPRLFDYIEHYIPGRNRGFTHHGLVTAHFSTQFGYVKPNGSFMMSTVAEDWSHMTRRAEKQHTSVEAPSVWRNHESRTCIVLKVDAGEVSFIPLQVDTAFAIEVEGEAGFLKRYLEPIEYPVNRAARLFVEYARNTGGTDEMLEALAPFTHITEEEKNMARQKASTRASEVDAPRKSKSKQSKAKAPADKKPRESAASVYREQIRSGKSAKQVVKKGEDLPAPKGLEA